MPTSQRLVGPADSAFPRICRQRGLAYVEVDVASVDAALERFRPRAVVNVEAIPSDPAEVHAALDALVDAAGTYVAAVI